MSLSLPGSPGISLARRSMLRNGRTRRAAAPAREPVVRSNSGKLGELAAALGQIQVATGLDARSVAARLLEQLDPSSPIRPLDVFAAGRADLVTTYLRGELDGAGLLEAWQRG